MVQAEQQHHRSLKTWRQRSSAGGSSVSRAPLQSSKSLWAAIVIFLVLVVLLWLIAFLGTIADSSKNKHHVVGEDTSSSTADTGDAAKTVYGTQVVLPAARDSSSAPAIEFVYSLLPDDQHPKGIALLLHACTHNALKFFSPNDHCSKCSGLSEELRIVRVVLERGYLPVAVTCQDQKSGCWSNDRDLPRLKQVLQWFRRQEDTSSLAQQKLPVVAIGASSGGHMAAKVVAESLADAALIMVMSLQPRLQEKLIRCSRDMTLYLAPMPRDGRTHQRVKENYQALNGEETHVKVMLDESSCLPLPVTVNYLMNRVVGLTREQATFIVSALTQAGHIGQENSMLVKDPTQSNWREILLTQSHPLASQSTPECLWGQLVLTRGQSPLAKAFHRAWAFHEYCSEAVNPALDFFERTFSLNAS